MKRFLFWLRHKRGWPLIDSGDPCLWPLFSCRVNLVRKHPRLYAIVWRDFR